MKVYFERFMICDCGESHRQTTTILPLDDLAKSLMRMQRKDFLNNEELGKKHESCKRVKFTSWKLGSIFLKK